MDMGSNLIDSYNNSRRVWHTYWNISYFLFEQDLSNSKRMKIAFSCVNKPYKYNVDWSDLYWLYKQIRYGGSEGNLSWYAESWIITHSLKHLFKLRDYWQLLSKTSSILNVFIRVLCPNKVLIIIWGCWKGVDKGTYFITYAKRLMNR